MDRPVHITHVPRRFVIHEWGGTETFISEVSIRLKQRGLVPSIHTTKALDPTRDGSYRGIPIRRYSYSYPYLGLTESDRRQLDRKAGNLFSWSLLLALLRLKPVDLFHLHTGKRLGGIVRFCALRRHIPYVVSLHGGYLAVPTAERETWTDPTRHAVEWGKILGMLVGSRRVLDDASAIICVGRDEYDAMRTRYPDKKVVHLPNGVDLERFGQGQGDSFRELHGIPLDRFLYVTVGRIDVQKNQLAVIEHLPILLERVPQAHVLLVGPVTNSGYRDKIVALAERLGVSDRVTMLHGFAYDDNALVDAYHAADCFVLPSLHEPFGMVVLEAWASRLPVVAARVGGLQALIDDHVDGLFIEPGAAVDDPGGLATAMAALAQDSSLCARLANAGYRKARQRYSWDHIADELIDIYRGAYAHTVH